uniref:Uncharacterized protein n=1 Tax=viral metagenome TaxID=1070528 RepID=A0A6C0ERS1_9ZZZZ
MSTRRRKIIKKKGIHSRSAKNKHWKSAITVARKTYKNTHSLLKSRTAFRRHALMNVRSLFGVIKRQ